MFNLGGMEIVVILVVALVVLGPDKLPKFMRTIGKTVGELRRASTEFQRTINTDLALDEQANSTPDATARVETPATPEAESVSVPAPSDPVSPKAAPSQTAPARLRAVGQAARPRPLVRKKASSFSGNAAGSGTPPEGSA